MAVKVFVSMMSAPASRYRRWIFSMTSGWVSDSTSLLPFRSFGWSLNRVAAEVGLGQAFGLEHRAHGPVDDHDALLQERAEGPFRGPWDQP